MEVTDPLKALIGSRASSVELKQVAIQEGMKTMFADGLAKVILGTTDLEELLRVAV